MTYYSIYCNERMVLDNLEYFNVPNRALKNLLFKDKTTTLDEKLEIYYKHRRYDGAESPIRHPALDTRLWWDYDANVEMRICDSFANYKHLREMQMEFFEDEDTYEDEDGCLQNPYCCWVDCEINPYFEQFIDIEPSDLEWKLDSNRRKEFEGGIAMAKNWSLREVSEVHMYKSDFATIEKAKRNYNLNELQTEILFGMIFVTRLYGKPWCRMDSKNRLKGFKEAFDRHVSDKDIEKVFGTHLFTKVGSGRDWYNYEERRGRRYYKYKQDYRYSRFEEQDEIAYTFKVTLETNKLNITSIFKEAMPNHKAKFCDECGEEFQPKSNRQKHCETCRAEIVREQNRIRQARYREKKGL